MVFANDTVNQSASFMPGALTGTGSIIKTGSQVTALIGGAGSAGALTNFAGLIDVQGGTLYINPNGSSVAATGTRLKSSAGTLYMIRGNMTVDYANLTGGIICNYSAYNAVFTVGSATTNSNIDGPITATYSFGIGKTGATTVLLLNNSGNNYTGATTITAGGLGGSGSSASSAHTVASGAWIFGGTGAGNAGTYTSGTLAFASGSILKVYSDGTSVSRVTSGAITVTTGFVVNLMEAMPAGTDIVLLANTGALPAIVPSLVNNSGRAATNLRWKAGTGLVVTLT